MGQTRSSSPLPPAVTMPGQAVGVPQGRVLSIPPSAQQQQPIPPSSRCRIHSARPPSHTASVTALLLPADLMWPAPTLLLRAGILTHAMIVNTCMGAPGLYCTHPVIVHARYDAANAMSFADDTETKLLPCQAVLRAAGLA